jgi:hypothetical protein
VIGFDPIVAVLLGDVCCGRGQFIQHPQVRAGFVGGHLDRRRGPDEESPCGGGVALPGQQHVDDLPVLVHGPVQDRPRQGGPRCRGDVRRRGGAQDGTGEDVGPDQDLLSDGCVRIATRNDLTAGWTGGVLDATGTPLYASILRNISGKATILDITGWR